MFDLPLQVTSLLITSVIFIFASDSGAGERVAELSYSLAKPAREFTSGEAGGEFSHGFATRVHGFSTKTKALGREIPMC